MKIDHCPVLRRIKLSEIINKRRLSFNYIYKILFYVDKKDFHRHKLIKVRFKRYRLRKGRRDWL